MAKVADGIRYAERVVAGEVSLVNLSASPASVFLMI